MKRLWILLKRKIRVYGMLIFPVREAASMKVFYGPIKKQSHGRKSIMLKALLFTPPEAQNPG
jgi:hypothetical protein